MKILIAHIGYVNEYPPVISLIYNLLSHEHDVMLMAYDCGELPDNIRNNAHLQSHQLKTRSYKNAVAATRALLYERFEIKKTVKEVMASYDILWRTTDKSARDIGRPLLCYKHVMQLMELVEYIPMLGHQKFLKADISKYARAAWKVVVPEYNRAYIQKAWWNLDKLPVVLPNKPYMLDVGKEYPENVKRELERIEEIKDKKIILYQGVFAEDRNLEVYAQAIRELGTDYCFCIMGKENTESKKLVEKYPFIYEIPFINPPYHLRLTSEAHIGLLPYKASSNCGNNSILNGIYCAPNKIFEYSAFGIPMLGSDVPGLKFIFDQFNNGIACSFDKEQIKDAILKIEQNYKKMQKNCDEFYQSVNLDRIVESILLGEE